MGIQDQRRPEAKWNRRDKEIRAARAERGPGRSHTGEQPGRVCVQARCGRRGGRQACREAGVGREGWRGSGEGRPGGLRPGRSRRQGSRPGAQLQIGEPGWGGLGEGCSSRQGRGWPGGAPMRPPGRA